MKEKSEKEIALLKEEQRLHAKLYELQREIKKVRIEAIEQKFGVSATCDNCRYYCAERGSGDDCWQLQPYDCYSDEELCEDFAPDNEATKLIKQYTRYNRIFRLSEEDARALLQLTRSGLFKDECGEVTVNLVKVFFEYLEGRGYCYKKDAATRPLSGE